MGWRRILPFDLLLQWLSSWFSIDRILPPVVFTFCIAPSICLKVSIPSSPPATTSTEATPPGKESRTGASQAKQRKEVTTFLLTLQKKKKKTFDEILRKWSAHAQNESLRSSYVKLRRLQRTGSPLQSFFVPSLPRAPLSDPVSEFHRSRKRWTILIWRFQNDSGIGGAIRMRYGPPISVLKIFVPESTPPPKWIRKGP